MPKRSPPSPMRTLARDSQLRLLLDALGRRRLLQRRARMQKQGCPSLAIIPDDEIGMEILQFGVYERRLLSLLFEHVLARFADEFAQRTVLDIGANIGNHAIYMSRRFKRVVAFEPGYVAYHLLQANLRLNGASNVDARAIGLSDRDAFATLAPQETNNIGSNAVTTKSDVAGAERIELRRGDAVIAGCADIEPIALVKIDVEGHEIEALRGLSNMLQAHRPIILFETKGKHGENGSDAILALLRGLGYENFYTLAKDFPFPHWRSPIARAAIRAALGARYVLQRRESFDDRYYNLAIATSDQELA